MISCDTRQIPRLAVVDTAKHTIALLSGLGGVRVFALSPDRRTLAAATESALYVAPVETGWRTGATRALSLDPSQVVWDLALSGDRSRPGHAFGTEDASGVVTDIQRSPTVAAATAGRSRPTRPCRSVGRWARSGAGLTAQRRPPSLASS